MGKAITSQQARIHRQGTWAEHHPSSPDTVLLGPMKQSAGSYEVILLSNVMVQCAAVPVSHQALHILSQTCQSVTWL